MSSRWLLLATVLVVVGESARADHPPVPPPVQVATTDATLAGSAELVRRLVEIEKKLADVQGRLARLEGERTVAMEAARARAIAAEDDEQSSPYRTVPSRGSEVPRRTLSPFYYSGGSCYQGRCGGTWQVR